MPTRRAGCPRPKLVSKLGPMRRIDLGEDAVTHFDDLERGLGFSGKLADGLELLPGPFDDLELIDMGHEARFGIVARWAGCNEELPVRGLEQQQLAAKLLHDALAVTAVL